jgi:hypothetical protein
MVMTEQTRFTHLNMYWDQRSFNIPRTEDEVSFLRLLNHVDGGPMVWQRVSLDVGIGISER